MKYPHIDFSLTVPSPETAIVPETPMGKIRAGREILPPLPPAVLRFTVRNA